MPDGMRGAVHTRFHSRLSLSGRFTGLQLNALPTGRHFLRPRLRGAFRLSPGQRRLQPAAAPLWDRWKSLLFPFTAKYHYIILSQPGGCVKHFYAAKNIPVLSLKCNELYLENNTA